MSNAAAIVEHTAEIFISRAHLMVPSLFGKVVLTSGDAKVLGGILYRADPFLPPVRHDGITMLVVRVVNRPKLLNKILLNIMNIK